MRVASFDFMSVALGAAAGNSDVSVASTVADNATQYNWLSHSEIWDAVNVQFSSNPLKMAAGLWANTMISLRKLMVVGIGRKIGVSPAILSRINYQWY